MPHLYKPWQRGPRRGPGSYWGRAGRAGSLDAPDDRRARRDAALVRIAGAGLLVLSVVFFASGQPVLGLIAFAFGVGMVILDTGLLLVAAGAVFGVVAVLRAMARPFSRRR